MSGRRRAGLPPRLRIKGLIPDQIYRVYLQYASENVDRANRRFDNPLRDEGLELSGDVLAAAGLGLPALYAQTGLAIAINAVEE